jgi:hypothetical protein
MKPTLRASLWLPALLMLGMAAWGGYYVCNHGFSRHWRLRVTQEFRKRGLDLYVHRLTLDPIQGFVARDVEIFDAADPGKVLAAIDRVDLDLNFTNLLHGKPFIDAVDMRNAALSVPVDEEDPRSERLTITELNARVIFPPHEWYVSHAEAMVYGIQVLARGRLQNPEAFQMAEQSGTNHAASNRPQMALEVLKVLEQLHFTGSPPRIEINFGGDLTDPSTLYADATVWAQRLRRGAGELTQLYAALGLRGQVIELKQCNAADAHGEMDASGSWNLGTGNTALELRSSLSPSVIARLLKIDNPVGDWTFKTPPVVGLSATGRMGDPVSGLVTGHVTLGRFAVKHTAFDGAAGDFAWDGKRWYVRNGWIGNDSGIASMRAMSLPGAFRAQVESGINPNSLRGLLSGQLADAMRDWDFQEAPKVSLSVTGTSADPGGWSTQGRVVLGRTRMRGVPLNCADAKVEVKGLLFTYRDFILQRDEGAATGTFAYDFDKHEAWLTKVRARLNTMDAAVWINPDLPRQLAPYRFKTAPTVTLDGYVQCTNDKGTHLDVHVDAPGGMDYTFCKRDLSFPRITGDLLFRENEILLKGINATLGGGSVRGGADIHFGRNSPGYTADAEVSQMDFASLTKLYFDYNSSHGLLDGTFNFGGANDDPWTLYGKGSVSVTDGNVFAIPLLGPFSSILNSIVPGMGYNLARLGTCTFAVQDGVISTHDFLVKGLGFSMIGGGRLFFLDDRLDFKIRLNAQGLPGVLLFPVSKLLEYAGAGTLEEPNWKPALASGAEPESRKQDAGAQRRQ